MRVVHVSPTDIDGGAAKGAYNLHVALRNGGMDSLLLVQRKYTDDPSVVTTSRSHEIIYDGLRDRLDRLPLKFHRNRGAGWWTVGWLPFDISSIIDRLNPDIVQFHWAGRGAAPINVLRNLTRYTIVWTLRDMWPLTGGCHYALGCKKFLAKCGACPQLGSKFTFDLSRWQWWRKHQAWRNVDVTYVAMSNWMANYARLSPLTFGREISVIPNGVDVERYTPMAQTLARSIWRIPTDKRVILFGALYSTSDQRKGFEYLRAALKMLAARGWKKRAIAVVFGAGSGNGDLGLDTHYVGRLSDEVSLALLYACADVMVVPSVQENCAKTAIEAMACGVPVVAFDNSGQTDIVDHKVNGYLAEDLSAEDLADGIAWCLERRGEGPQLSRNARSKAVQTFDVRRIAVRHVELYQRLLGRRSIENVPDTASEAIHPQTNSAEAL
ncbi:MAG: glycosyl transferase [Rhodospirillales bacterium CG15_BIG_FIL_POST_REV_8_21_14_020_66_15]|nr:MAG: glycosyl transferase [Rhodospirillales bacterium CG15_BIG_FIL_POST_REV_8_21_14_020_66_15]